MPSTVGLQATEPDVVVAATQLQFDCQAAYGTAARKAHLAPHAAQWRRMADEAERATAAWQARLQVLGHPQARPNRLSAWLNAAKVRAVAWAGDRAIGTFTRNNPHDCVEAYGRVSRRQDLSADTRALAERLQGAAITDAALIDRIAQGEAVEAPSAAPAAPRAAHR